MDHGVCLAGLGRYAEAEASLLEGHELIERGFGVEHARTVEAIRALIDLYDAWGKPDKAAEWRAKLAETEEGSGAE